MTTTIRELPVDVRSKLESGVLITDAVQCVISLVHNSLDAEATAIVIKLDLKNYQIQVIDNGKGISKDDLKLIGKRYMTSKYHVSKSNSSSILYGYKGQAISSLLDVCKSLIIKTRAEENGPFYIKTFQNSKALPIAENNSCKTGTGTTVIINDFLFNMPIRRRRINEVFDIDEVKQQLQYLSLMHNNVSFTLKNEFKNSIVFKKLQTSSLLESIISIFDDNLKHLLTPLNYQDSKFKVSGFLSLKPLTQNGIQLLYVNKRIITKGIIHKFIINLMKEYFSKNPDELTPGVVSKNPKSSFSLFIIEINCSNNYFELFTNLKKTTVEFRNWKEILKCIHKAIKNSFEKGNRSSDLIFSSNSSQEDKNVYLNNDDDKSGTKNLCGTSVLANAVKGASAKRVFTIKEHIKNQQEKENFETSDLLSINENNGKIMLSSKNFNLKKCIVMKNINDLTQDSLESPIPKKKLKLSFKNKAIINSTSEKFTKEVADKSFMEFYKWLKFKFETDGPALNLYNEFLLQRQNKFQPENDVQFKSPVLGNQMKRKKYQNYDSKKPKQCFKSKKILLDEPLKSSIKSREGDSKILSVTERNIKFVSYNRETAFTENKKLDFQTKNKRDFSEKCFWLSNEIRSQRALKKGITNCRPSSDAFFKSLLRFRNLPESFMSCASHNRDIQKNFTGVVNSWSSHYENQIFHGYEANEKTKDSFSLNLGENHYLLNSKPCRKEKSSGLIVNNSSNVIKFQDVGVQTTMFETVSLVEKRDFAVQANNETLKSPQSFKCLGKFQSFGSERNENNICQKVQIFVQGDEATKLNLSEEFSFNLQNFSDIDKLNEDSNREQMKEIDNVAENVTDQKNSSSEFVCAQKSNQKVKSQSDRSESKETQTITAMWTDCLEEIVKPGISGSDSVENKTISGNTELPNTIPLMELENGAFALSSFCLTDRHCFIPKGLSPKFIDFEPVQVFPLNQKEQSKIQATLNTLQNEALATIKWEDESTGEFIKPTIPNVILSEMREKAEKNVVQNEAQILFAPMPSCPAKVRDLLHSFAFTKEMLSEVKIIGQLDKKFIVVKMNVTVPKKMELICLFDQHAVDERIRLEDIEKGYVTSEGKLITSSLSSPIDCELKEEVVQLLSNFKDQLSNLGLDVTIINDRSISIQGIPKFLMETHIKNIKNKKNSSLLSLIQSLITSAVEEATQTRGIVSKVPKIIHDAFCSNACQGAIKFNKVLTKKTMKEMIYKLKTCNLPFQCAHGRPSVIPIIDLEDFKIMENNDFKLYKLKKFV